MLRTTRLLGNRAPQSRGFPRWTPRCSIAHPEHLEMCFLSRIPYCQEMDGACMAVEFPSHAAASSDITLLVPTLPVVATPPGRFGAR
jgi:hypothetical protein